MLISLKGSKLYCRYNGKFNKTIIKLTKNQIFSFCRNYNILFFGNDNFSLPSLEALIKAKSQSSIIQNVAVVTSSKNKIKTIHKFVQQNQLKCLDWPITRADCYQFDLGVVASFGHLIPESIISAFPHGMINVHASLLPRWRGAAPVIYAIMMGDNTTGVTIMRVRPKHFDIGEILAQREVCIGPNELMPQLHDRLANEGADLLINCINRLPCESIPQCERGVTYGKSYSSCGGVRSKAPKVKAKLGHINWNTMSAKDIYNRYRALYTFQPIVTKFNNITVKLLDIKIGSNLKNKVESKPGRIVYDKNENYLRVSCSDGSTIAVKRLHLDLIGKKSMNAADFHNGFLAKDFFPKYFS